MANEQKAEQDWLEAQHEQSRPYPGNVVADSAAAMQPASILDRTMQDFNRIFGEQQRELNCNGFYSRMARGE